jgi:hypothetical protein
VSNLDAAIGNARAFVGEVVGMLRGELAAKEPAEAVP